MLTCSGNRILPSYTGIKDGASKATHFAAPLTHDVGIITMNHYFPDTRAASPTAAQAEFHGCNDHENNDEAMRQHRYVGKHMLESSRMRRTTFLIPEPPPLRLLRAEFRGCTDHESNNETPRHRLGKTWVWYVLTRSFRRNPNVVT